MEANGQFYTPASLNPQTRKKAEYHSSTGCWKEKNLFLMPGKGPILQSMRM
jgi:hypothetical protein